MFLNFDDRDDFFIISQMNKGGGTIEDNLIGKRDRFGKCLLHSTGNRTIEFSRVLFDD